MEGIDSLIIVSQYKVIDLEMESKYGYCTSMKVIGLLRTYKCTLQQR